MQEPDTHPEAGPSLDLVGEETFAVIESDPGMYTRH